MLNVISRRMVTLIHTTQNLLMMERSKTPGSKVPQGKTWVAPSQGPKRLGCVRVVTWFYVHLCFHWRSGAYKHLVSTLRRSPLLSFLLSVNGLVATPWLRAISFWRSFFSTQIPSSGTFSCWEHRTVTIPLVQTWTFAFRSMSSSGIVGNFWLLSSRDWRGGRVTTMRHHI